MRTYNVKCVGCSDPVVRASAVKVSNRAFVCESCAKKAGLLEECHGEAHSNPYIDNCGVCMPRWGVIVRPESEVKELWQKYLDEFFVAWNKFAKENGYV